MPLRLLGTIGSSVQKASTAFESIATATSTGSSATLTFSSIPSTYQHLQIRGIIRNANAGAGVNGIKITVNSDTGANYAYHVLYGNGTSAVASASTSQNNIYANIGLGNGNAADLFSPVIIDLLDYQSTTKNKTFRIFGGNDTNTASTSYTIELQSGLWMSTSAVTSITLQPNSAVNFVNKTTFALYGIKGA